MKRKQDQKGKDFLETYSEDEKMMWKVAVKSDEQPVMPELRLKEGSKVGGCVVVGVLLMFNVMLMMGMVGLCL